MQSSISLYSTDPDATQFDHSVALGRHPPRDAKNWRSLFDILRDRVPEISPYNMFLDHSGTIDPANLIADWLQANLSFQANMQLGRSGFSGATSADLILIQMLALSGELSNSNSPPRYINRIRQKQYSGDFLCVQAASTVFNIQIELRYETNIDSPIMFLPAGLRLRPEAPLLKLVASTVQGQAMACQFDIWNEPTQGVGGNVNSSSAGGAIESDDMMIDENFEDFDQAQTDESVLESEAEDMTSTLPLQMDPDQPIPLTFNEWRKLVDEMTNTNAPIFRHLKNVDFDNISQLSFDAILCHADLLGASGTNRFSRTFSVVRSLMKKISKVQLPYVVGQAIIVARDYHLNAKPGVQRLGSYPQVTSSEGDVGYVLPMVTVGFVQFGKTTNMALVSALLFDLGVKYIVLTAGRTVPLQRQGHGRMAQALGEGEKTPGKKGRSATPQQQQDDAVPVKAEEEEHYTSIVNEMTQFLVLDNNKQSRPDPMFVGPEEKDMTQKARDRLVGQKEPIPEYTLFVVKKNAKIIRNVMDVIDSKFPEGAEVVWMDDECDELTLNTKKNDDTAFHRISKDLVAKLGSKNRKCLYLGYTATVPACLLQPPSCVFYPLYFSFLGFNSPTYQGLDTFFSPEMIETRNRPAMNLLDFAVAGSTPSGKPRYFPVTTSSELLNAILDRESKGNEERKRRDAYWLLRDLERVPHLANEIEEIKNSIYPWPGKPLDLTKRSWNFDSLRRTEVDSLKAELEACSDSAERIEFFRERAPWLTQFVFRSLLSWSEIRLRRNRSMLHLSLLTAVERHNITIPEKPSEVFYDCWKSFFPAPKDRKANWRKVLPAEVFVYNKEAPIMSKHMAKSLGLLLQAKIVIVDRDDKPLFFTDDTPGHALKFQIIGEDEVILHVLTEEQHATELIRLRHPPQAKPDDDGAMVLSAFGHLGFRIDVHVGMCIFVRRLLDLMQMDATVLSEYKLGKLITEAYQDMRDQRDALKEKAHALNAPELTEVFDGVGSEVTEQSRLQKFSHHLVFSGSCSIVGKFSRAPPPGSIALSSLEDPSERIRKGLAENWIVIGGEIFCRGITVPNLVVSLFGRVVSNQEQLLQFCRWFGHRRPELRDLTVVFCGNMQMEMFSRLWDTVTRNFQVLHELYRSLRYEDTSLIDPRKIHLYEHPSMKTTQKNRLHHAIDKPADAARSGTLVFATPPSKTEYCRSFLNIASDFFFKMITNRKDFDIRFVQPAKTKAARPNEEATPAGSSTPDASPQGTPKTRKTKPKAMNWRNTDFEDWKAHTANGFVAVAVQKKDAIELLQSLDKKLPYMEEFGDMIRPRAIAEAVAKLAEDTIDIFFPSTTAHREEKQHRVKAFSDKDHIDTLLSVISPIRVDRAEKDPLSWDYKSLCAIPAKASWESVSQIIHNDDFAASEQNSRKRKRKEQTNFRPVLIVAILSWLFIRKPTAEAQPNPIKPDPGAGAMGVAEIKPDPASAGDSVSASMPAPLIIPKKDAGAVEPDHMWAAKEPPVAVVLVRKQEEGADLMHVKIDNA